ncbi:MAG: lipoprotein signal peptidase [Bacteroidetes bacterium]|nr:MAG: lipoprotein signal peptidase [Bacteroidota bacterium]
MKKAAILIILVLIIDQVSKIWIKTNMTIGDEIHIMGNWFIIHFTENEGMAFGMKFGGSFGKLILSIFRIIAVIAIGWYLINISRKKESTGLIISLSLIFAGAMGNIIDSTFYGVIFSESKFHEVAQVFPPDGGYGNFLHGKVVDMLYFPVLRGAYPQWIPWWGGNEFIFFRPVFNIADSAITIGVFILILFQKKFFTK